MKIKKIRLIFLILTLITFIIIFKFSSEDAKKSSSTSRGFTKEIIEVISATKKMNKDKKENLIENSQKLVRKLAHFSIYTVAGLNLIGFINTYEKIKKNKKITIAILIGFIYAITDEFHQMFSNGRTPAIKDVCIDTIGIAFGNIIFLIINYIKERIKIKKS